MTSNFKDTSGKFYDGRKVTLCAILVGDGNDKEKAETLFEFFDEDKSDNLGEDEVRKILESIAEMAIEWLP